MSWLVRLYHRVIPWRPCAHRRTTFPRAGERPGARPGCNYVCCLNCGRKFEYDFHAMKRGAEIRGEAA
jgi:hypothetical protein